MPASQGSESTAPLPLEEDAIVAYAAGELFPVQMFQQRDRVLARNIEKLLELGYAKFAAGGEPGFYLLLDAFHGCSVENEFIRKLDQYLFLDHPEQD